MGKQVIRQIIAFVFYTASGFVSATALGQTRTQLSKSSIPASMVISQTCATLSYGENSKQVLDFWAAPEQSQRPLLVFIHGGGWGAGDKSQITNYVNLNLWLDKGVSLASVNYRLTEDAPLPAPVHDAALAIQFLRYKAKLLNLDPSRIVLMGVSAGGCSALWIALHDDLANPSSADPVARQSTRVSGAYVYGAQTSIDPLKIKEWIGEPAASFSMIYRAVGAASYKELLANYDKYKTLIYEFSPINHLDVKDPPIMLFYGGKTNLPAPNWNAGIHHPVFAMKLKEKADRIGYSAYSFQYGDKYFGKETPWPEFLESLLLGKTENAQVQSAPENDVAMLVEPQKTGWPLTTQELKYISIPESVRRFESAMNKGVPSNWPSTPSAGYWEGRSWIKKHSALVHSVQTNRGPIDILLVGDSITQQWGGQEDAPFNSAWQKNFGSYKAVNIGIGGDKTQNVLWRLDHGGVEGLQPRLILLLIGNNNMFYTRETGIEAAARGIQMCVKKLRDKFPDTPVVVVKVFPAIAPGNQFYEDIKKVNSGLDDLHLEADSKVHVLNLWGDMINRDGTLKIGLFKQDNTHLTQDTGYELYASKLKPLVLQLLGESTASEKLPPRF